MRGGVGKQKGEEKVPEQSLDKKHDNEEAALHHVALWCMGTEQSEITDSHIADACALGMKILYDCQRAGRKFHEISGIDCAIILNMAQKRGNLPWGTDELPVEAVASD